MTDGKEAVLKAKVSMYEKWLREHVPDCPLLVENIVDACPATGEPHQFIDSDEGPKHGVRRRCEECGASA